MIQLEQITAPLILSFKTVGYTSVLLLFIGIPLAFLLSQKKLRFRWIIDTLVTLPLVFPPIAVGFFLLLILGEHGWLGEFFAKFGITFIFDFYGLVVAGFIAGLPLMVKPLEAAIRLFPEEIKEAAYISGKSTLQTFFWVVLPNIKASLFAALLLASARSLGEVGITLMLGGNIIGKTDTVSLAIYNAVFDGEYDLALILSGILVVISLLFFIILHFLQNKKIIG
ncbi:molybdate ABC transporter permease subunit [Sulfurovum sp. zt1-1]|uniref:Molybdenum transport system permease n=1 Tax=Sulfurovum zhangzhouensis TaxID=3019067 RepID=A0ABT7QX59_9BACT|nr:molybdate ABC transporter permease subunit [Sulfurovum zhangzhouensis]MDM5271378.1 molybdate ABC transporter permease subunit [Sulfurovum zhangzhouensis]